MIDVSLKIENDNQKYIIAKIDDSNKVIDYQIDMVNNNLNKGLLYIDKRQFNSEIYFQYDITNYVSLKSFVKMDESNAFDIISILKNVIWIYKSMQDYLLYEDSLILDIDYIFISLETKDIGMIYVPTIINNKLNVSMRYKELLKNILQNIYDKNSTDNIELKNILQFIINSKYYSEDFAVESFENYEKSHSHIQHKPQKPEPSTINNIEEMPQKKNRFFFGFSKKNKKSNQKNIRENTEEFKKSINLKGKEISNVSTSEKNNNYILIDKNGTYEKINISGSEFIIGRLQDKVQYCINNSAISKKHAMIVTENNCNYLVDMNSSNGTFLNGKKLESGKKYQLNNGDEIEFANIKATYKSAN